MRRLEATLKITAALTVAACLLAVAAASASAVSIEPLSTKFSANSSGAVEWSAPGARWECAKGSIAGTTESTKVSFVKVTPTFAECTAKIAAKTIPITYTNDCEKGTVPWTLTFNEGGKGQVKLNCALKASLAGCVMTMPAQTVEKGFEWSNVGTKNLNLAFPGLFLKVNKATTGCELLGFGFSEVHLSAAFEIAGIQAH